MKARESATWKWLKQAERSFGDRLFMERVENVVGSGFPDVRGTYNGRDFFLELKSAALPARLTTPIRTGLRPEQVEWAKSYMQAGGRNLFVLIRVGPRKRFLIAAPHFQPLYDHPVIESRLAELSMTPPDASPAAIIERASVRY